MPPMSLKARALRLLARREHSRAELAAKLAVHATTGEVAALLDELADAGLLSDARFAASWLHRHGARFGCARLRQELRQKGVDEALIGDGLATLPNELERARAVWARKFGQAPADARDWARQARFLAQRGFSTETIRRVLHDLPPTEYAA